MYIYVDAATVWELVFQWYFNDDLVDILLVKTLRLD